MHPLWVARNRLCDPANIFNHFSHRIFLTKLMKTYRFVITGRVQGVFYRKTIQESARAQSIRGSIKNLPDGSVKVLAALRESDLPAFVDMLNQGSPNSKVNSIAQEVIDGAELEYDSFVVKY